MVVGIIGGGQLAGMLTQAAIGLGVRTRILARPGERSAVAGEVVAGDWRDAEVVCRFASGCDVVTFDHELVPDVVLDALEAMSGRPDAATGTPSVAIHPSPRAMRRASDKLGQRQLAASAGLGVVPHRVVASADDLAEAVSEVGPPAVAKQSRGGYDGRGIAWLRSGADVAQLAAALGVGPVLVEPDLALDAELAVTVARRRRGDHVAYPVVRTYQDGGICRAVVAPAATTPDLAATLTAAAIRIAEDLDHVGVLTVEAFLIEHRLYLNELAPRPHNSAHYTIDACTTSQFENHLRAILDLPLGDPGLVVPAAAMANVIAGDHGGAALGEAAPGEAAPGDAAPGDAALPSGRLPARTRVHWYGKVPRPGRKIGHVTTTGDDRTALLETCRGVAERLTSRGGSADRCIA